MTVSHWGFAQEILLDIPLSLSLKHCGKWSGASISCCLGLAQAGMHAWACSLHPRAPPPSTQRSAANTVSDLPLHTHRTRIIVFLGTSPAPSNPHQRVPAFGVSDR